MAVEEEKGPFKWFKWAGMLQVTHFPLLFLSEEQSCRTLLCSEHASVYGGTVWKCFCLDPCLHEPSISLGFRKVPKSPDLNRDSLACLHRELPEGPRFQTVSELHTELVRYADSWVISQRCRTQKESPGSYVHTESNSRIVLIVRASECERPNAALSRAHQRGTPVGSSTRLHVRTPWMNLPVSAYSQKRCIVSVEAVPPSVRFWLSCHTLDGGYKCVHSTQCVQPAAHRPVHPQRALNVGQHICRWQCHVVISKLDTSAPLLCPGLHPKSPEFQVVPELMHFLHSISAHTFLYHPWVLTSVWFLYGTPSHKSQVCSAMFSISMYQSWRDDSVGKSTCCVSMATWVQTSNIHIKSWAWLHVFVTSPLWGQRPEDPKNMLDGQPCQNDLWPIYTHAQPYLPIYYTWYTHHRHSDTYTRRHSSYSSFMCICY